MGTPDPNSAPAAQRPPERPDPLESLRKRSQLTVMVGLLLTFAGLFAYGVQVPVQPASLDRLLPWLAVGFLCSWIGGIFVGNARNPLLPGVPPAFRGQAGLGLVAAIAAVLSAGVVVQRVGLLSTGASGGVPELEAALLGVVLALTGGLLMGRSMRRFVRRRRPGRGPTST